MAQFKKLVPPLPKEVMEDKHKEKMEVYLAAILNNKEMRERPEVQQLFRLQQFLEEAHAQEDTFGVIQIPD